MADIQEQQYQKMMLTPVSRLIPSLAWPTVLSMMTSAIYNTADTWFVSHLGDSATGATGVCLPVVAMIQAVGFWIGMEAIFRVSWVREKIATPTWWQVRQRFLLLSRDCC